MNKGLLQLKLYALKEYKLFEFLFEDMNRQ
jgi:hypothetical protein